MKKNYKKMLPLFLFFTSAITTGCSNNNILSNDELSKLDSYITSMTDGGDVDADELEETISKSIPAIKDKDKASNIINKYIYILYNEARNYLPYFDIIGQDIVDIKNKLNIEKIDVSMYKDISKESKVIGALFEEMYNMNLTVIDENNSFFTEVNVQKILDEYRKYLNKDIIDFLEFRALENSTSVFDVNTDEYDIDLLLERANTSINKAFEKTNSEQLQNWKDTASYYYQIILAENTSQFLEDNKVKSEYVNDLKEKLEIYKGNQIYTDLIKYIDLLEINNYDINSEDVAYYRAALLENILNSNQEE